MKNFSWIVIAVLFFATGCQSGETAQSEEQSKVVPVVNVVQTDGPQKVVARLAIEGMGCEMACGGAIKKALGNLDGVIATDIDFDSERETDFAIVEFDEQKVNSDKMVETVSTLRKGQYKVSGVTIEKQVPPGDATETQSGQPTGAAKNDQQQIDTRTITVPNILDILNRLFVRS